ncbi:DMT family transporter [Rhizobium sp. FKY42]|uniref:DMT family transporter n=1 Tax=Rhizobium sp. FKY42 TaxID=2562310 RepID=UPI00197CDC6F|nr:DMT family transporter [Rhizobium sp. FKY42]
MLHRPGDTSGKLLTVQGVSPFFVAWSRFTIAGLVLITVLGGLGNAKRQLLHWPVIFRGLLITCAICTFVTALRSEPIANVFGVFFVGPIVSYVLAALLLGEKVTVSRSVLLGLSFLGVLLVVKPGFGVREGILLALLAGCLHGSYLAATRWLSGRYEPRFMLASQLVIGAVVTAPLGLATDLPDPTPANLFLICLSALGSALGNYLIVVSSRMAPSTWVAPLMYSQLIAATVAGVAVFGQWPDAWSLVGLAVILLSGLSSFWIAVRQSAANAKL